MRSGEMSSQFWPNVHHPMHDEVTFVRAEIIFVQQMIEVEADGKIDIVMRPHRQVVLKCILQETSHVRNVARNCCSPCDCVG